MTTAMAVTATTVTTATAAMRTMAMATAMAVTTTAMARTVTTATARTARTATATARTVTTATDGEDGDDGDGEDGDDGDGDGEDGDDGDGEDGDDGDGEDGDDGDGDDGNDGHDSDDRGDDGDGRRDDGEHDDDGDEGGDFNVNINVPLSAVEPLLGLVPHRILSDGRLTLAGRDMPIDMGAVRGLWRVIADSGDAEFITVDSEDATVRVSRAGEWMLVKVEECDEDGGETVDIRFPVAVLDALFSGDGDTLDIGAAVERLADMRGDIVHVRGDDHQVRVWIDEVAHAGQ